MRLEKRWLRETYVDLLLEYAMKDPRLVLVEADLMKAAGTNRFAEKFPERVVDVGIAEADMIGIAAGLSLMGKIPFTHTFASFSSRRACDQVTLSVSYAGLNVIIMGSDPGITAELNGGTHMALEDIAIMRNIPGMVIYEPVDSNQLIQAFPQIVAHDGPVYIRLLRRQAAAVNGLDCPFELGKGTLLRKGKDVTIFASGIMVALSMDAAAILYGQGIEAEVINIHTIKPIDREMVVHSARKTGAVVTAENHMVTNGLGSAVAEVLCEEAPTPMCRVGVQDHFGEVGLTPFLLEKYGMDAKSIAKNAVMAMAKRDNK